MVRAGHKAHKITLGSVFECQWHVLQIFLDCQVHALAVKTGRCKKKQGFKLCSKNDVARECTPDESLWLYDLVACPNKRALNKGKQYIVSNESWARNCSCFAGLRLTSLTMYWQAAVNDVLQLKFSLETDAKTPFLRFPDPKEHSIWTAIDFLVSTLVADFPRDATAIAATKAPMTWYPF
nr:hypothetical protein Iba_chr11dCG13460 [Ipomoea batatas]